MSICSCSWGRSAVWQPEPLMSQSRCPYSPKCQCKEEPVRGLVWMLCQDLKAWINPHKKLLPTEQAMAVVQACWQKTEQNTSPSVSLNSLAPFTQTHFHCVKREVQHKKQSLVNALLIILSVLIKQAELHVCTGVCANLVCVQQVWPTTTRRNSTSNLPFGKTSVCVSHVTQVPTLLKFQSNVNNGWTSISWRCIFHDGVLKWWTCFACTLKIGLSR